MTTAIQTATTTAPAYLLPAALAVMGNQLMAGKSAGGASGWTSSLRSALMAGYRDPETLTTACGDDIALTFGVLPTDLGILAYTQRMVLVGFNGLAAHDSLARTVAPPAVLPSDPIWAIWPWGYAADAAPAACMARWSTGVTKMLNSAWAEAVELLQTAASWSGNIAYAEQYLIRRALAANIRLAVKYSHGG